MVYQWKENKHSAHGVSAQLVGETVERLIVQHEGVCPPGALVEEAKPKSSPLHALFIWDDKEAAHQFRLAEARRTINHLCFVVDDVEEPRQAFINISIVEEDGVRKGYSPFMTVVQDDFLRAEAIAEALRALNGFRKRYAHLTEFAPVIEAIDEIAV